MPDEWEERHGLDKNNADDGMLVTDDGYTNLEHYLNSLVKPKQPRDMKYTPGFKGHSTREWNVS